jgi:hypothetical protein
MNRISRFLYPTWMHPGRIWKHNECGNKSLLKIKESSYKRPWWGQVDAGNRVSSSFQVLLKPMLTYGKRRTL